MTSRTRRALGAVLAGLLAIAGLTLAVAGSASAANLVVNPGFDAGTTSGWTCSAAVTVTTTTKRTGTHAMAGTPAGHDNARCSQTITVQANTAYSLSAWVQGSYVYLGVTGTGSGDKSTWTPGTTGFGRLAIDFTTGATSSVTIYVHGWYGQPTFYADDVSLDGPGTPPTSTTTIPTTTSTTTPTTTTTGNPNPTLPKHALTGYWHNFDNGSRLLRLADVPTTYDIVAVAFADATATPGAVAFTLDPTLSSKLGGYTDAQFKADVRTL